MASTGLGTGSASVTSMNYVGFEELKGEGASELLYNQIFIEPNQPVATSSGNIAAVRSRSAKQRRTVWSKSRIARDLELQGFKRVYGVGS